MAEGIPPPQSCGTYLICLADYVVALDLVQTVAEARPAATVIQTTSAAEALSAVMTAGKVKVAFIGTPPQRFEGSELAMLIAQKGGRVVFIGSEAEDLAPASGRAVLHRPFSTAQVLAHLNLSEHGCGEQGGELAR